MRVVLITGGIGIPMWLFLMWLLGPVGIYIGYLLQSFIRSLGVAIVAGRQWNIRVVWVGVMLGILLLGLGFLAEQVRH